MQKCLVPWSYPYKKVCVCSSNKMLGGNILNPGILYSYTLPPAFTQLLETFWEATTNDFPDTIFQATWTCSCIFEVTFLQLIFHLQKEVKIRAIRREKYSGWETPQLHAWWAAAPESLFIVLGHSHAEAPKLWYSISDKFQVCCHLQTVITSLHFYLLTVASSALNLWYYATFPFKWTWCTVLALDENGDLHIKERCLLWWFSILIQ
jgi:hypothetical protein